MEWADRNGLIAAPWDKEDTFSRQEQAGDREDGGHYVVDERGLVERLEDTLGVHASSGKRRRYGRRDRPCAVLAVGDLTHSRVLEHIAHRVRNRKRANGTSGLAP